MAEVKRLEDYEYRIEVREVDPATGNVLLVFSEVDGNDGFGVTVSQDFLQNLIDEGKFDEWAEAQIENRLNLLKSVRVQEERREKARKKIEALEAMLKEKRIKAPRR